MKKLLLNLLLIGSMFCFWAIAGSCGQTTAGEELQLFKEGTETPASKEGPVVLLLSHNEDEDSFTHYCATLFKRLVEEKSDGELFVDVYPLNQLGGGQSRTLLRENTIQLRIGTLNSSTLSLLSQPMLSGIPAEQITAELEENQALMAEIEKDSRANNVRLLCLLPPLNWELSSSKPVRRAADLKGLQVRCIQAGSAYAYLTSLEADVISYSLDEAYVAIRQGMMEGNASNSVLNLVNYGLYWQNGYLTMTDHAVYLEPLFINRDCYASLTSTQQQAIDEAAAEMLEAARSELTLRLDAAYAKLDEAGVEIIELSKASREEIRSLTYQNIYDTMAQSMGPERLEQLLAIVTDNAK